MSQWYIEPRDPLVVRDARPNEGRSQSAGLSFPLPGSLAGAARTRLGSDPERGFVLQGAEVDRLLAVELRGPLLCDGSGALFFPPPHDAVVMRHEMTPGKPCKVEHCAVDGGAYDGERRRKVHFQVTRLQPLTEDDVEWNPMTSADDAGSHGSKLALVGLADGERPTKPQGKPPSHWDWPTLRDWLLQGDPIRCGDALLKCAHTELLGEHRIHVALGESLTAREGMLFHTPGLRFASSPRLQCCLEGQAHLEAACVPDMQSTQSTETSKRLGLWLDVSVPAALGHKLAPGLAPMAGERRLVRWVPLQRDALPPIPEPLLQAVQSSEPCQLRIVLLTPACFTAGAYPNSDAYLMQLPGAPRLVAARVDRATVVSGWDFKERSPKATRRLAPAGSVYWVELGGDVAARLEFLKQVWFRNISDDPQARRDGFGLAAVGVVP